MNNWPFLENLFAVGIEPEEVDYIVFTHLHVDHVGWNTVLSGGRWTPTFPNASYLIVKQEWEYWSTHYRTLQFRDDPYYEDSIFPLFDAGQVVFVDANDSIADGVRLEHTPGHTPGHVCVHIASGGQEAIVSGDIMHHPLQCAEPDLNSCFCVDPKQSRVTRRSFLEQYAETSVLIMPAHFPAPTVGHIIRVGETWRFSFHERGKSKKWEGSS
jgi:glyoxylase-like metal-dependent hydrolase (beta-lactamase superfamily II)